MHPTREELEIAVAAYWQTKDQQLAVARTIRSTAEGSSKAVRGGGHFNPLVNLISRFFTDAGYPLESVGAKGSSIVLPSYFRTGPEKPWLGYLFLMDDAEGSRRPTNPQKGPFPAEEVWYGRSYQDRFEVTGRRLLDEGFYDAVCYLVSSVDDPVPESPHPNSIGNISPLRSVLESSICRTWAIRRPAERIRRIRTADLLGAIRAGGRWSLPQRTCDLQAV